MNLKVGDKVKICKTGNRTSYVKILHQTGVVRVITEYTSPNTGRGYTYYVEIPGMPNENQQDGFWVFRERDMLIKLEEVGLAIADHADAVNYCFENLYSKEKEKMELLQIYFDNQMTKISLEYHKASEKIKKQDETYNEIAKIREKYNNVDGFFISLGNYVFDKEIAAKLKKLSADRDQKECVLRDTMHEIEAQLEICTTYEQKQQVLKAYKILDENGILIK